MTASVGDVVAQLRAVLESLDAAVITTLRAQADADQAKAHFTEAATGTDHSKIRAAVTASHTASEKTARYARLLAQANESLTSYLNTIAPGSVSTHRAPENAAPTGEQIVQKAVERTNAQRSIDSYLSRMTRGVENLQDTAKTSTETVQQAVNIVRKPPPPGLQQAEVGTPSMPSSAPRPKIDAPEAAGHIVVVGLVAGVAIYKFGQIVSNGIARLNRDEHKDRTERSGPRDSSP